MPQRTCSIDGCDNATHSRGWCSTHYNRWRLGKDMDAPVQRRATGSVEERFWAHVDKSGPDGCWLWTAGAASHGYGQLMVWEDGKGAPILAHRLSYEMTSGPIPDGALIDHVCHNRQCVNPEHLRLATRKQNAENYRPGSVPSNNTSGQRGAYLDRRSGRWYARVVHNGTAHTGGRAFATADEAAAAARSIRNQLFTYNDADRM